MDAELKKKIDSMDYEEMLSLWRFTPTANPNSMFQDEVGEYYQKVMLEKERMLAPGEKVEISKKIGW